MDNTCAICLDTFNKTPARKRACCPYCDIKACVKCTQTYLINTHDDPHCMNCRRGWTREVIDSQLLTTWINGEYKKHRENILLDRERSRLPAAQLIIEREKKAQEYDPALEALEKEIKDLEQQLVSKREEYLTILRIKGALLRGIDSTEENTRRVFVMPCPVTGCRGFLSQAYKCGICDTYVCPDCREIKGTERDADHTCDQNVVATIRALKKETRPCPDCGANIFKIEGCNQMFCTNCNTPFDWLSGRKIVHGAIHNPHYFEYLRAANGGVMPRNPGDIPCGANLPTPWTFDREISRRYPSLAINTSWLYQALNTITHIQHVEIDAVTNNAQDIDNTEQNLRYLRNEITEIRWKQLLQQREKRRLRRDEIRLRYEAFVGACVDIYRRIYTFARTTTADATNVISDAKEQLLNLRKIFNDGMMDISKRYKCKVMQLSETNLRREMKKYESGKVRRVKRSEGEETTSIDEDDDE